MGNRLEQLLGPQQPEVSCETCFEQLDRYVELERSGGAEPEQVIPGMKAHLEGCSACADDHAGLHAWLDQR